jgi:CheY-like chemotaxis protein
MGAIAKNRQGLNTIIDVLIVDGSAIDQKLLSSYLKEYDVSFDIAINKIEAIKKLKDFTFKLILVDVETPEIEGYRLVQMIRTDLDLAIPIVGIITHDVEEVKTKCFGIGIAGCFTKPISKIEVVGVLTQFDILSIKNIQHTIDVEKYRAIDLSYLKEVSMGDTDYEREITSKFIEVISNEIAQLDDCLENERFDELKSVAHKMLSTIYVMGLGPKLSAHLQAIEYDDLSRVQLEHRIELIKIICAKAKEEAQVFLAE